MAETKSATLMTAPKSRQEAPAISPRVCSVLELAIQRPFSTASAKASLSVISMDCAAVSCSAWASRSAAIHVGIVVFVGKHKHFRRDRRSCRCRPCRKPVSWLPRHRRCPARQSSPPGRWFRRAVSEGGNGLRAADAVDFRNPGQLRGRKDQRIESSPSGQGTTMTMRSTPATTRRDRIHQDGTRIARHAAGNVKADCLDRGPTRTKTDTEMHP